MPKSAQAQNIASKTSKKEIRKALIRNAALNRFSYSGYENTSLQDIANELGITHAGLYYYYENKADLLFDAVLFSLNTMKNELSEVAKQNAKPDIVLECLIHAQIELQFKIRHAVRLIDSVLFGAMSRSAHLNKEHLGILRKTQKEIVGIYKNAVLKGIESGLFKPQNASIVTLSIIGTVSNVPYWFDPNGSVSASDLKTIVCDMVFHGIQQ